MARSSKRTTETVKRVLRALLRAAQEQETNDTSRAITQLPEFMKHLEETDIPLYIAILEMSIEAVPTALSRPSGDILAHDAACWQGHVRATAGGDGPEWEQPPF